MPRPARPPGRPPSNDPPEMDHKLTHLFRRLVQAVEDIAATLKVKEKCPGRFVYNVIGPVPKEESHMQVQSTTEFNYRVGISPVSAAGKPAPIQAGSVSVTVTGGGTFVDEGSGKILLKSEDIAGMTSYQISADADLGDGVETISDVIDYTYTDPKATSLGLQDLGAVAKP